VCGLRQCTQIRALSLTLYGPGAHLALQVASALGRCGLRRGRQ
jgi:hypothetical protein